MLPDTSTTIVIYAISFLPCPDVWPSPLKANATEGEATVPLSATCTEFTASIVDSNTVFSEVMLPPLSVRYADMRYLRMLSESALSSL